MVSVTDCWAENSPEEAPWSMIACSVASREAASGAMKASSQVVQLARSGARELLMDWHWEPARQSS